MLHVATEFVDSLLQVVFKLLLYWYAAVQIIGQGSNLDVPFPQHRQPDALMTLLLAMGLRYQADSVVGRQLVPATRVPANGFAIKTLPRFT